MKCGQNINYLMRLRNPLQHVCQALLNPTAAAENPHKIHETPLHPGTGYQRRIIGPIYSDCTVTSAV